MTQSVFWTKQFFLIDVDVFLINVMFVMPYNFFSQDKKMPQKS